MREGGREGRWVRCVEEVNVSESGNEVHAQINLIIYIRYFANDKNLNNRNSSGARILSFFLLFLFSSSLMFFFSLFF